MMSQYNRQICPDLSRLNISVSILIPLYNHKSFIGELLDSIENIGIDNFEVLIMDDGSTDGSFEEVQRIKSKYKYTLKLFRQENRGLVKTMNILADISKNEILCFIASDDIYYPNSFASRLEEFEDNNLVVSYGNGIRYCDGIVLGTVHDGELECRLVSGYASKVYEFLTTNVPAFYLQSMMIRRKFFYQLGKFDEQFILDDWAFNLKIFKYLNNSQYIYKYTNATFFIYRVHSTNTSKDREKQFIKIDQVIQNLIPIEKISCFYEQTYAGSFIYFLLTAKWKLAFYILKNEGISFYKSLFTYSIKKIFTFLKALRKSSSISKYKL